MSTIIENKKAVAPTWQSDKVQEEALKSVAAIYASLEYALGKENPQLVEEAAKIILINKAYYATLPIKAPYDLVNAVAEYAVNVLGIKVAVVSDINKPSIVFEGGTLVNKLVAINNVPPDQVQPLVEAYKKGLVELGTQYGYATEIATADPDFIVTYSK